MDQGTELLRKSGLPDRTTNLRRNGQRTTMLRRRRPENRIVKKKWVIEQNLRRCGQRTTMLRRRGPENRIVM